MISPELFTLVLLTVWGCCVGSFLNVVVFRVPEGLSIISPPSRCPGCATKLAWYDNVPVLGWLWLRGKCRTCRMRISPQYPLVEVLTGLLFAVVVYVYYFTDLRPLFTSAPGSIPGSIPGSLAPGNFVSGDGSGTGMFGGGASGGGGGVAETWPVLGVHLTLVACMIAATLIDAKLFIIPLGITWVAALAALLLPGSVLIGLVPADLVVRGALWDELMPLAGPGGVGVALGGMAGLGVAVALLRAGKLPLSFAEEPELPEGADPDDPNLILVHPHPRREVCKEVLFLLPALLGAGVGYAVMRYGLPGVAMPVWLHVLAGVLLGYLVGGGVVWGVRIFGTLLFGKEAMGLGDVHLMAAVGAVIGWRDVTLAFFIAPFIGIAVALITAGLSSILTGKTRVIPYGPSLCVATLLVMLFRNPIFEALIPPGGGSIFQSAGLP